LKGVLETAKRKKRTYRRTAQKGFNFVKPAISGAVNEVVETIVSNAGFPEFRNLAGYGAGYVVSHILKDAPSKSLNMYNIGRSAAASMIAVSNQNVTSGGGFE
jgi:hypothetical protein